MTGAAFTTVDTARLACRSWGLRRQQPPQLVRRHSSSDVVIKEFLHLSRWPAIWKERWAGPANLDRAGLRITGFDTYALVAAVLLQVIISLYGSLTEPQTDDPRIKYPRLQRIVFEAQLAFLMLASLCSTFTMVTFLLCKIFSVMALSVHKDVAWQVFTKVTRRHRLNGFYTLISALLSFLVAYCLNIYTKIKGNRGLAFTVFFMLLVGWMVDEWIKLVSLGGHLVYSAH